MITNKIGPKGQISLSAAVVAPGLMVLGIILFMGAISGAPSEPVLRGRGGDAISYAAGSGVLDEGSRAAKQRLSDEIDRGEIVPPGITDADTRRATRD